MKKILSFGLCLLISVLSFAQGYRISGKILDQAGLPVPGAAVTEDGTLTGITSDENGTFSLMVSSSNAAVSVSMIGYKTLNYKASDVPASIVLVEDNELLDDVVVIGYGTVKKQDLTGSIAAIKAEDINRGAVTTASDLLLGKVPGMLVLSDGTIRIRGISSLNASNDPLVVIDGIPASSNGLSSLNPDDIDSFSVLKDASSAAIYGSRAASGVIMVTTKKAARGKLKVSYSGSVSTRSYIGKEEIMDADEYRAFIRQLYADRPGTLAAAEELMGDANTDWRSLVSQFPISSTHNVGISGTVLKGNLPYRVSLGYRQNRGMTLGSWSHRPTVNVMLSPTFFDKHLSVQIQARINTSINSTSSASYSSATSFNPTLPVYFTNPDGSIDYDTNMGYYIQSTGRGDQLIPGPGAASNPMQYDNTISKPKNLGWTLSSTINYKVHGFEDLSFNLRLSTDRSQNEGWSRTRPGYWGLIKDSVAPGVGTYRTSAGFNSNDMLEAFANWQHDFNGHNLSAMAGYSYERYYNFNTNETHLNDDYTSNDGSVHYDKDQLYGNVYKHGEKHFLVSFYGRLNYSYKSRYMFTATIRDDGSSRFAKEHRWGLFPSFAAAWNIAEEPWFKNKASFLSELKFRAGWGVTGQESGIANYSYLANYNMSTSTTSMYNMGSDGRTYFLTPQAYDPNVKWEETITANAGIDFSIKKGKVSGNIDYYNKTTKDLLNRVTIPMGANFSNEVLTNIGSMVNNGIELGLTYNIINKRKTSLLVSGNLTYQDTKFTKLTVGDSETNKDYFIQTGSVSGGTGGYLQQQRVGYAPRVFYTYQQAYDHEGNPIQNALVDRDGNGTIDENDRYLTGKSPLPKWFYGMNVKFTHNNWDFGFNVHGSIGNWAFWDYHQDNSTPANDWINYSHLYNYKKIVTKTGWTDTCIDAQRYSDYFLYDASFLKVDDVNLGYSFRNLFKDNTTLRLALSVNNMFMITKYPGVDPEIGASGIDSNGTPRTRVFTLRANINF